MNMFKNKNIFLLLGFAFVFTLCLATSAFAEEIDNFEVELAINQDSSIDVKELIVYDFGTEEKHGIFRDIPYVYKISGANYKLRLSDFAVTDGEGKAVPFSVSGKGQDKRIKIGDPDVLVSGAHVYAVSYHVERALGFLADYDELYWNATGNGWVAPIAQSKTIVKFPVAVDSDKLKYECYAGPIGSTAACVSSRLDFSAQAKAAGIVFSDDYLSAGSGITIKIDLPKGVVEKPSLVARFWEFAKDNWIILLPFLVLGFFINFWKKHGKDPKGMGTIIAEFSAPDNLSPSEVGVIIDEKAQQRDISAEIIHLAVNGYLKINKLPGAGIMKRNEYEFVRLRENIGGLKKFQKTLFEALFCVARERIKLSELKNKFYSDMLVINEKLYNGLAKEGYFFENPKRVRAKYFIFGSVVILAGFASLLFRDMAEAASLILSGVVVFVFGFIMPKKTTKGVLARERILGLKKYISVAEKDRIEFHNDPQRSLDVFEKLLPYAMVLGIEKAWAGQFADLYDTNNPAWYDDAGAGHFPVISLVDSLSVFRSYANDIFSAASASSGHGGFGGGSSGGGFGGGGGGSW